MSTAASMRRGWTAARCALRQTAACVEEYDQVRDYLDLAPDVANLRERFNRVGEAITLVERERGAVKAYFDECERETAVAGLDLEVALKPGTPAPTPWPSRRLAQRCARDAMWTCDAIAAELLRLSDRLLDDMRAAREVATKTPVPGFLPLPPAVEESKS